MVKSFYFAWWWIVVIPKSLAARSPIQWCIHFCIWVVFSGVEAFWMLHWSSLDNLLQNGVFTSEFGTRNSYFGWSIWICCLQICILWRLLCRIARRCRLRDHTYQPQKVLSWKVTCIRSCMLFCVYIPTSEDVWVGWVSLKPFWNVWSCFERFWTIVFACDRLK